MKGANDELKRRQREFKEGLGDGERAIGRRTEKHELSIRKQRQKKLEKRRFTISKTEKLEVADIDRLTREVKINRNLASLSTLIDFYEEKPTLPDDLLSPDVVFAICSQMKSNVDAMECLLKISFRPNALTYFEAILREGFYKKSLDVLVQATDIYQQRRLCLVLGNMCQDSTAFRNRILTEGLPNAMQVCLTMPQFPLNYWFFLFDSLFILTGRAGQDVPDWNLVYNLWKAALESFLKLRISENEADIDAIELACKAFTRSTRWNFYANQLQVSSDVLTRFMQIYTHKAATSSMKKDTTEIFRLLVSHQELTSSVFMNFPVLKMFISAIRSQSLELRLRGLGGLQALVADFSLGRRIRLDRTLLETLNSIVVKTETMDFRKRVVNIYGNMILSSERKLSDLSWIKKQETMLMTMNNHLTQTHDWEGIRFIFNCYLYICVLGGAKWLSQTLQETGAYEKIESIAFNSAAGNMAEMAERLLQWMDGNTEMDVDSE